MRTDGHSGEYGAARERMQEIARIFAAALVRLGSRAAVTRSAGAEKPQESSANRLELGPEVRLSVQRS
jgi:hypothetical protein